MIPKGLSQRFRSMFRSEFIRNASTLVMGTVIAQMISVGLSPVLSRLYTPQEFGNFGILMSIVGALAVIATLRYELAIMLPVEDHHALNLCFLSFFISLALSLLVLILIIAFRFWIVPLMHIEPVLITWLYFIPLLLFLYGINQALNNWFNRKKGYKLMAYGRVINSTGVNGAVLGFGLAQPGPWGLLWGNITGLVIINIYLLAGFFRKMPGIRHVLSRRVMREQAIIYKEFPKSNGPQSIVEMLQMNGIVYLLMIFFSSTIIGYYTFSMRVLQAPMWFFGASIAQVFYKKATETYQENGDLQRLFVKMLTRIILISAPFFIILILTGPWLFSFIFGKQWHEAGIYSQLLAVWLFFDLLRAPMVQIPMVLGRMKKMFRLSLLGNLILLISLLYAGLVSKDVKDGFIILSVLMSIYITGLLVWIYRIAGNTKKA